MILKFWVKVNPKPIKRLLNSLQNFMSIHRLVQGNRNNLGGGGGTLWSRRITQKHRLIYEIIETVVHVDVLSAYGHYDDK